MGTRDIKLHYNREWQAVTDVYIYKYKYKNLIQDIMRHFLPVGVPTPNFNIKCEVKGEYIDVYDDHSLLTCLSFSEMEVNMFVEIGSDRGKSSNVSGQYNKHHGYYVEEVDDMDDIVILDSDTEELDETEVNGLHDDIQSDSFCWQDDEEVEHDDVCQVELDESEVNEESNCLAEGEEEFEEVSVGFSDDHGEVRTVIDVDEVEEGEQPENDWNNYEFSTDEDVSYEGEENELSEDDVSLDNEEECNADSEDCMSNVDSDGEGVNCVLDDPDEELLIEKINRINAGIWFKKDSSGNINLQKELLFHDVYHYRDILREYVIQEGFEIIRLKNEKARVTVACKEDGCPWRLHASPTPDGKTYKIKTYESEHTCLRKSNFKEATYSWIADKLRAKFAAEPNKSIEGIKQDLKDMYGITGLSAMKLWRIKQRAKTLVHGDCEDQYAKVRGYGELILAYNPGSFFVVQPYERSSFNIQPMFKRVFLVFDGVKRGFLQGCRPFFGVDGCFLKGPYGGMFLAAIALDGNNGILPIAVAIVETENIDSWSYFFEMLKEAIGGNLDGVPWTIMSDRQKGLIEAVHRVFPDAMQRFYLKHIEANFKLKFKGGDLVKTIWDAGYAYNLRGFETHMRQLKESNPLAHEWLHKIPCKLWSRHAMNPSSHVDHISNNVAESFNSWINRYRDLPILSLLEAYRMKVMKRLYSRYERASKWKSKLVPNVTKQLNEEWARARKIDVVCAGQSEYQCKVETKMFVVNLHRCTCDCGKWMLTGIPCMHAIACIRMCNKEVEDNVNSTYTVASYFKVYNNVIYPQPDIGVIEKPTVDVMLPPPFRRTPGRPKKTRKLHPSETLNTQRSTVLRCSICKEMGHNMKTYSQNPRAKSNQQPSSQSSQGGNPLTQTGTPTTTQEKTADSSSRNKRKERTSTSQEEARIFRPKLGVRRRNTRQTTQ